MLRLFNAPQKGLVTTHECVSEWYATFLNILVPIDGSVHSYRASDCPGELAAKYGSRITLLYVANTAGTSGIPEGAGSAILQTAERHARSLGAKTFKAVID